MTEYVDKEKILKYLEENNTDDEWIVGQYNADWIYSFIESQPTADVVEVKHGRWENRTFIVFDNEIKDGYRCSECNTTWDTDTNYCPNCGVKMDGGEAE